MGGGGGGDGAINRGTRASGCGSREMELHGSGAARDRNEAVNAPGGIAASGNGGTAVSAFGALNELGKVAPASAGDAKAAPFGLAPSGDQMKATPIAGAFGHASFGPPAAFGGGERSNAFAANERRQSIDDSWISVDWSDVSKEAPQAGAALLFGAAASDEGPLARSSPPQQAPAINLRRAPSPAGDAAALLQSAQAEAHPTPLPAPLHAASAAKPLDTPAPLAAMALAREGGATALATPSRTSEETALATPFKANDKVAVATPSSKASEAIALATPSEAKDKMALATPSKADGKVALATPAKTAPPTKAEEASPATTSLRASSRMRKSVDRLSLGAPAEEATDATASKGAAAPLSGSGTRLGDIAHIAKELGRRKADYAPIVALHRLLYGRPGEAARRKANLRNFNGLARGDGAKAGEGAGERLGEKLAHQALDALRRLADLLNVERGGEKRALCARLAAFLATPTELGTSQIAAGSKRGKAPSGGRPPAKAARAEAEGQEGESGSVADDESCAAASEEDGGAGEL